MNLPILHKEYPQLDRGISDYLDGKIQLLPICQCCQGVSPTPPVEQPLDFSDERYRD